MSRTVLAGRIEVIFGPMFSGKSSQLLRRVRRFEYAAKKCLVVNYIKDTRYFENSCLATHDRQTYKAISAENLSSIRLSLKDYEVIAVDEGQFFPDIVQMSQQLANAGKIVIVAALDGTFERKPFGNILSLLPLAENVQKLSAVCVFCYKEAGFTLRTADSKEIELIGGVESYKPVCRGCFHQKMNSFDK